MRYWLKGQPISPIAQTNTPAVARYWLKGQPIGRVNTGSIPPPPPGSGALPTGLNLARRDEEDEFRLPIRYFATLSATIIVPYQRPIIFREVDEDWMPPRQRYFATLTVSQDNINISILW